MSVALPPTLSLAIYIEVINIQRLGYISDEMLEEARKTAEIIANHGDILLYDKKSGEASKIFAKLARAIACLAFSPGGVEIFGMKFESKFKEDLKEGIKENE